MTRSKLKSRRFGSRESIDSRSHAFVVCVKTPFTLENRSFHSVFEKCTPPLDCPMKPACTHKVFVKVQIYFCEA